MWELGRADGAGIIAGIIIDPAEEFDKRREEKKREIRPSRVSK